MRRQIGFAIYALKNSQTIEISAFGFLVEKAVRMAEIIKLRLGMLHQDTALHRRRTRDANEADSRESTGIVIKLSRNPLDKNSVGYQKPKPIDESMRKFYYLNS